MRTALMLATLILLNGAPSWAQGLVSYGAYYVPAPVVVVPAATFVQTSYVPVPVVTYAAPVYAPPAVIVPPVVAAPVMHTPYSVAARQTAWVNRYGANYTYREYGPLGAQRYHYTVHSRPNGYVVREHGY